MHAEIRQAQKGKGRFTRSARRVCHAADEGTIEANRPYLKRKKRGREPCRVAAMPFDEADLMKW